VKGHKDDETVAPNEHQLSSREFTDPEESQKSSSKKPKKQQQLLLDFLVESRVRVRAVEGKGKGLFAAERIPEGTQILIEKPLFGILDNEAGEEYPEKLSTSGRDGQLMSVHMACTSPDERREPLIDFVESVLHPHTREDMEEIRRVEKKFLKTKTDSRNADERNDTNEESPGTKTAGKGESTQTKNRLKGPSLFDRLEAEEGEDSEDDDEEEEDEDMMGADDDDEEKSSSAESSEDDPEARELLEETLEGIYPGDDIDALLKRKLFILKLKHNCHGTYTSSEMLFGSGGYQKLQGTALYGIGSIFNHSCSPNLARYIYFFLLLLTNIRVFLHIEFTRVP